MRPKLFTFRNLLLILVAVGIFGGLALWGSRGFPLPGQGVPSTAGKLLCISTKDGKSEVQLLSADGSAAPLTPGETTAGEPAFSPDGSLVSYTAERDGVRQLCLVEAAPGRKHVALTRTSASKQLPAFQSKERIFFLDAGKVSAMDTDASDPLAIFPTAEGLNQSGMLKALFNEGGIKKFAVSPDGKRVAVSINRERGQILVLHEQGESGGHEDNGATVVLGMAESILPHFLADGTLVILYIGGAPFGQPMALPDSKEGSGQVFQDQNLPIPPLPDELSKMTILVQYDSTLKPVGQFPLPVKAKEIAVSPTNHKVAFTGTDASGNSALVVIEMNPQSQPEPKIVFSKACQDPSWSPDGSQLAFTDGSDVFVAPGDGSREATNLTNGKLGMATRPSWSPALPDR